MSTISHEPSRTVPQRRTWPSRLLVREMWAAMAIGVVWIAVLFTALFAPDLVSTSAGVNSTTIPSVILVVPFAMFATWPIAKYGFGRRDDRAD